MSSAHHRLRSLDAFRGLTIAAMLLVNNPGDWGALYPPLAHAAWHGWTLTDLIFPFFVFISGVAMTLSLGHRATLGRERHTLLLGTWRRGAVIVALGLLLNFIPNFSLETLRWPGVLQRLGLCTIAAAPLAIYTGWRVQAGVGVALLTLYTGLMLGVPVAGADGVIRSGALLPGQDTASALDRWLMAGHLWAHAKTWDPEGLLSTLPAVASQIAGLLVGHGLATAQAPATKRRGLVLAGGSALLVGALLDAVSLPINKALWTPAYVFLTTGWACWLLAGFHALLDVGPSARAARAARWLQPLTVLGMNALFLFVLSSLVAKALGTIKLHGQSLKALAYAPIQALPITPVNASLLFALAFVAVHYGIARFMFAKQWFVKV